MNKLSKVLMIIIAVVVIGGIAAVLTTQKSSQPSQPNGQIVDNSQQPGVITSDVDTSDWQTYRNEEVGFEIKYPNDWRLTESDNQVIIGFPDWREGLPEGGTALDIQIRGITLGQFIDEYRKPGLMEDGFSVSEIGSIKDYLLDGHPAHNLTGSTGLGIDRNFIFTERNGLAYIISFHGFDKSHVDIISTFKFLKN